MRARPEAYVHPYAYYSVEYPGCHHIANTKPPYTVHLAINRRHQGGCTMGPDQNYFSTLGGGSYRNNTADNKKKNNENGVNYASVNNMNLFNGNFPKGGDSPPNATVGNQNAHNSLNKNANNIINSMSKSSPITYSMGNFSFHTNKNAMYNNNNNNNNNNSNNMIEKTYNTGKINNQPMMNNFKVRNIMQKANDNVVSNTNVGVNENGNKFTNVINYNNFQNNLKGPVDETLNISQTSYRNFMSHNDAHSNVFRNADVNNNVVTMGSAGRYNTIDISKVNAASNRNNVINMGNLGIAGTPNNMGRNNNFQNLNNNSRSNVYASIANHNGNIGINQVSSIAGSDTIGVIGGVDTFNKNLHHLNSSGSGNTNNFGGMPIFHNLNNNFNSSNNNSCSMGNGNPMNIGTVNMNNVYYNVDNLKSKMNHIGSSEGSTMKSLSSNLNNRANINNNIDAKIHVVKNNSDNIRNLNSRTMSSQKSPMSGVSGYSQNGNILNGESAGIAGITGISSSNRSNETHAHLMSSNTNGNSSKDIYLSGTPNDNVLFYRDHAQNNPNNFKLGDSKIGFDSNMNFVYQKKSYTTGVNKYIEHNINNNTGMSPVMYKNNNNHHVNMHMFESDKSGNVINSENYVGGASIQGSNKNMLPLVFSQNINSVSTPNKDINDSTNKMNNFQTSLGDYNGDAYKNVIMNVRPNSNSTPDNGKKRKKKEKDRYSHPLKNKKNNRGASTNSEEGMDITRNEGVGTPSNEAGNGPMHSAVYAPGGHNEKVLSRTGKKIPQCVNENLIGEEKSKKKMMENKMDSFQSTTQSHMYSMNEPTLSPKQGKPFNSSLMTSRNMSGNNMINNLSNSDNCVNTFYKSSQFSENYHIFNGENNMNISNINNNLSETQNNKIVISGNFSHADGTGGAGINTGNAIGIKNVNNASNLMNRTSNMNDVNYLSVMPSYSQNANPVLFDNTKLKDNGNIRCNGKYGESLHVNGYNNIGAEAHNNKSRVEKENNMQNENERNEMMKNEEILIKDNKKMDPKYIWIFLKNEFSKNKKKYSAFLPLLEYYYPHRLNELMLQLEKYSMLRTAYIINASYNLQLKMTRKRNCSDTSKVNNLNSEIPSFNVNTTTSFVGPKNISAPIISSNHKTDKQIDNKLLNSINENFNNLMKNMSIENTTPNEDNQDSPTIPKTNNRRRNTNKGEEVKKPRKPRTSKKNSAITGTSATATNEQGEKKVSTDYMQKEIDLTANNAFVNANDGLQTNNVSYSENVNSYQDSELKVDGFLKNDPSLEIRNNIPNGSTHTYVQNGESVIENAIKNDKGKRNRKKKSNVMSESTDKTDLSPTSPINSVDGNTGEKRRKTVKGGKAGLTGAQSSPGATCADVTASTAADRGSYENDDQKQMKNPDNFSDLGIGENEDATTRYLLSQLVEDYKRENENEKKKRRAAANESRRKSTNEDGEKKEKGTRRGKGKGKKMEETAKMEEAAKMGEAEKMGETPKIGIVAKMEGVSKMEEVAKIGEITKMVEIYANGGNNADYECGTNRGNKNTSLPDVPLNEQQKSVHVKKGKNSNKKLCFPQNNFTSCGKSPRSVSKSLSKNARINTINTIKKKYKKFSFCVNKVFKKKNINDIIVLNENLNNNKDLISLFKKKDLRNLKKKNLSFFMGRLDLQKIDLLIMKRMHICVEKIKNTLGLNCVIKNVEKIIDLLKNAFRDRLHIMWPLILFSNKYRLDQYFHLLGKNRNNLHSKFKDTKLFVHQVWHERKATRGERSAHADQHIESIAHVSLRIHAGTMCEPIHKFCIILSFYPTPSPSLQNMNSLIVYFNQRNIDDKLVRILICTWKRRTFYFIKKIAVICVYTCKSHTPFNAFFFFFFFFSFLLKLEYLKNQMKPKKKRRKNKNKESFFEDKTLDVSMQSFLCQLMDLMSLHFECAHILHRKR
ncbi:conserved Plasmodium protein, unknown function [Plasmodium ovale wallikeri]|uniref:Uncharacterized protein n=1 Tax=Plasmodium ovale wallikeri TaxID=864142 RepID=A0A1A8Z1K5_PLAOA|nr:conserved Plasmodium protein, unknown function [Plasmodium ovale wallikeri]